MTSESSGNSDRQHVPQDGEQEPVVVRDRRRIDPQTGEPRDTAEQGQVAESMSGTLDDELAKVAEGGAEQAAAEDSALSSVIAATACGNTSPVALCRVLSTPTPSGLVSDSGRPARPASLRSRASGSATPVTAMPYFGSGSSTLCPPATGHPARRPISAPPRSTS